jgi:hypothetical protein
MSNPRPKFLVCLAAASAIALSAGSALATVKVGDYVGKTEKEITASLEKHGFKIDEIEREGGYLEAEVTAKDGKMYEVQADPKSGKVVEIVEGDAEEGSAIGAMLKRVLGIGDSKQDAK